MGITKIWLIMELKWAGCYEAKEAPIRVKNGNRRK